MSEDNNSLYNEAIYPEHFVKSDINPKYIFDNIKNIVNSNIQTDTLVHLFKSKAHNTNYAIFVGLDGDDAIVSINTEDKHTEHI